MDQSITGVFLSRSVLVASLFNWPVLYSRKTHLKLVLVYFLQERKQNLCTKVLKSLTYLEFEAKSGEHGAYLEVLHACLSLCTHVCHQKLNYESQCSTYLCSRNNCETHYSSSKITHTKLNFSYYIFIL